MSVQQNALTITVLGREYQFKAPPGQQAALQLLANVLDENVSAMQAQSPLANRDQLLVLSAINTLHELSQIKQQNADDKQQLVTLLQHLKTQPDS